eukprot:CAMPEP_0178784014 /NCGR_PEP_ID=MMETSP0745-20121128/4010_1 /TAXON_ID=913974 /ORGANISM="Nitzschia punctata, Strain CCMP561" /LENGTH=353 /DNA_ID=CAMNT_0020441599 /DNA_START=21 /DNA_END=1082 /DNA_ORIENTATION=+
MTCPFLPRFFFLPLLLLLSISYTSCFVSIVPRLVAQRSLAASPRYGPPLPSQEGNSTSDRSLAYPQLVDDDTQAWKVRIEKQHEAFRDLIQHVMTISEPELLPRVLANNMDLVMSLRGEEGTRVISTLLEDAKLKGHADGDEKETLYTRTLQAVDLILSFAEDFVEQAQEMDNHNKKLLGKIIMAMRKSENDDSTKVTGKDERISSISREEVLDQVLEEEKHSFTPGFLRHIEGECERICKAPKMTRESARLLEILRVIQTRVLEELGKEMGEATLVLGQLMGYDNDEELLGVLDAGLTVRGIEFAAEMSSLTAEALDGFKRVPGGVDPELVERVTFIDNRLREFLDETNKFQ